jgi:hypothetical protein
MMTFATKLEILKRNGTELFETGINSVRSIEIGYADDRIIIEFDANSEWDYKIISFYSIDSFQFLEEKQPAKVYC